MSDSNSPDTKEPQGLISRRRFLKNTAIAVGTAFAGSLGAPAATAVMDLARGRRPDNQYPAAKEIDPIDQIKTFIFQGYTPEEIQQAEEEINKYAAEYSAREYKSMTSLVKGYQYLIEDAYQAILRLNRNDMLPTKIDPVWKNILLGIIFIESKGDPKAAGKYGEKGLCQLKDQTVESMKKILEWGDIDVFKPGINITLGLTYLLHEYGRTGEPGMAIWAYHEGESILKDKVCSQFPAYRNYDLKTIIEKNQLNPVRVKDERKAYFYQAIGAGIAVLNSPGPK